MLCKICESSRISSILNNYCLLVSVTFTTQYKSSMACIGGCVTVYDPFDWMVEYDLHSNEFFDHGHFKMSVTY